VRLLEGLNDSLPVGRQLTEAQVHVILDKASDILQNDADPTLPYDVGCPVRFELEDFELFPSVAIDGIDSSTISFVQWQDVSSKRVARRIHRRVAGRVKVVNTIGVCGGRISAAIRACAVPRRGSVIVPTWPVESPTIGEPGSLRPRAEDAANLWLHEIGHLRGLGHRNHVTNGCADTERKDDECASGNHASRPLMCEVVEYNEQVCQSECDRWRQ
jgi:hypothetical protein